MLTLSSDNDQRKTRLHSSRMRTARSLTTCRNVVGVGGHVWQGHAWQGACMAGGVCGRGSLSVNEP